MTDPTPEQLAPNIDPAIRDYIRAVVQQINQRQNIQLEDILTLAGRIMQDQSLATGQLNARVNLLERAINLTPATRRKMEALVALLAELDQ